MRAGSYGSTAAQTPQARSLRAGRGAGADHPAQNMSISPAPVNETFAPPGPASVLPTAATKGAGAGAGSRYQPSGDGLSHVDPAQSAECEPEPELFREVFGRFATGVAVITSAGSAGAGGMTANALCSVSLEPLLALVCFANSARTLPIVRETPAVRGQPALAESAGYRRRCSPPRRRRREARPSGARARGGDAGDHRLAGVGDVRRAGADRRRRPHDRDRRGDMAMGLGQGDPLLWFEGRYHQLPPRWWTRPRSSVHDHRGPSQQHEHDKGGERHHPHLAPDDGADDQLCCSAAGRRPTSSVDSNPRASMIICAEEIRSCSAMNETRIGSTPYT